MRYIFIINSFANYDAIGAFNNIKSVCEYMGLDYVIEVNDEKNSTEMILDKYKDGSNIIYAVGGDGMINQVLNGIINTGNMLGYIPFGTGNDFHRTVKEVVTDKYKKIDAIRINDKYFVNIACFGIDADIANDDSFVHNKFIPKGIRYDVSSVYHLCKYPGRHLEIKVNDLTFDDLYTTVVVTNGRYYGGGYKVGTYSLIDDGVLEVYMIKYMPKLKMAKGILGMKKGKHEMLNELTRVVTDRLVINSDDVMTSNVDGERLSASSFDIELIHNGVCLYNHEEIVKRVLKRK